MSKSVRWCYNFTKWTPTQQDLLLATSCIQPEEKIRLGKFVFKKDFKSSLIGRLLMRKYVAETCAIDYNQVKFNRDEHGRPTLENITQHTVNFNVSHQGDFTVFAGEPEDILIGVDVMKLEYTGGKSLSEFFRIMNRNFSSYEWKQIYKFKTEKEQLSMFCRFWSLKESYVKAIGVGITIPLSDISFKVKSPLILGNIVTDTELYVKGCKLIWYFEESLLDEMHCVAVATNKKVNAVKFSEISFSFLTEHAKPLLCEDKEYCSEYFNKRDKHF